MIVKPRSKIIQELGVRSFTVVGGPGADGLGTGSMQALAAGLAGAEGDFAIILGDVSPIGNGTFYRPLAAFIDRVSLKPVHVVPGDRDGPDFEEHFGYSNLAILAEDFTLILLDNSGRRFADETLAFFRDTLAMASASAVAVGFHTPPPNRISGDSLSAAEWSRFEDAAGVWRKKISLLICSRGGGYFEDELDDIRLVVAGGGSLRPRDPERVLRHLPHAVEFSVGLGGVFSRRLRTLPPGGGGDEGIRRMLEQFYDAECRVQTESLLDATEAEWFGLPNLARLFRAISESRLRMARNLRRTLEQGADPSRAAGLYQSAALRIADTAAAFGLGSIETAPDPLAAHALLQMEAEERNQAGLLHLAGIETADRHDIPAARYSVCASCGLLRTDPAAPAHCPACGAPGELFREIR